jgi:precorrin-2/cobalt-factor-2 C20-methyltransferase
MTGPTLAGVGMGPGDPELVTVKAVRVLREADLVLVPVMATGEHGQGPVTKERGFGRSGGSGPSGVRGCPPDGAVSPRTSTGGSRGVALPDQQGRAEATVRAHVTHDRITRVAFALTEGAGMAEREAAWDGAADAAVAAFAGGASVVAFATIGDPNVYSTFTYLAATVRPRVPGLTVVTVPGITAMQDLAARSGTVLCEGTETLALLPLTAGLVPFTDALARFDTVVGYKSGSHLPEVLAAVRDAGRIDGAVHGVSLGLPGEDIRPAAEVTGPAPYLSTLLVPGRRTRRGGKL